MSKGNINRLLAKIISESDKNSPDSAKVRRLINKRTHYYDLDLDKLIAEVSDEIKGTYGKKGITIVGINSAQEQIIVKACTDYFNSVKSKMTVSVGQFKADVIQDSNSYFNVKITSPNINDNFETFLNANRKPALAVLRKYLFDNLRPTYNENIDDRLVRVLDPGHKVGSSIAEQRAKNYLKSFDIKVKNFKSKLPPGVKYEDTPMYRLEMAINSADTINSIRQTIKVTDIYVTEQGRGSNYQQSITEAKLIATFRSKIKQSLLEQDWVNFSASTSPIGRAANLILDNSDKEFRKSGAKVKSSKRKKTVYPAKTPVSTTIKGKSRNTSSSESISSVNMDVEKRDNKVTNWASLISIINAKLPERVANNMGAPGLVYRTGRFANSTKVVNVETTRDGYPSVVFDYERDPYDVFDRTNGASPWNTPARDPRALVDKSVREIVQEMAIGRFYTRRA